MTTPYDQQTRDKFYGLGPWLESKGFEVEISHSPRWPMEILGARRGSYEVVLYLYGGRDVEVAFNHDRIGIDESEKHLDREKLGLLRFLRDQLLPRLKQMEFVVSYFAREDRRQRIYEKAMSRDFKPAPQMGPNRRRWARLTRKFFKEVLCSTDHFGVD